MRKFHVRKSILPPGTIVGTRKTLSLKSLIIARQSAGPFRAMSPGIAAHTTNIVHDYGVPRHIEMTVPKPRKGYLAEYDNGRFGDHITFVTRPDMLTLDQQDKAQRFLTDFLAAGMRYGWDDIAIEYGIHAKDNPDTMVCSEVSMAMLRHVGVEVPFGLFSPWDLQRWLQAKGMLQYNQWR